MKTTWCTYSVPKKFLRIIKFTLPVSFLNSSKSFDRFSLILVEVVLSVMKPSRKRLRKRLCMLRIFFSKKLRLDIKKSKTSKMENYLSSKEYYYSQFEILIHHLDWKKSFSIQQSHDRSRNEAEFLTKAFLNQLTDSLSIRKNNNLKSSTTLLIRNSEYDWSLPSRQLHVQS